MSVFLLLHFVAGGRLYSLALAPLLTYRLLLTSCGISFPGGSESVVVTPQLASHWDTGLLCLEYMGNLKKAVRRWARICPSLSAPVRRDASRVFQPGASAPPSFISLGRQKAQPNLCFDQGKEKEVRITATWHESVWIYISVIKVGS